MYKFFRSDLYNFELTRLLGCTSTGGCDVAEFLEAVGKLKVHDPETWLKAWAEQSARSEEIAREAVQHGHRRAALGAFLRAANYARASGYMLTGSDARIPQTAERSVALFKEACAYMEGQVVPVDVPYRHEARGEIWLPGYLYLPPGAKRLAGGKAPVLINCCGADSTQEELYFALPAAGLELGYAVLTFEGPGQGIMRQKHKTSLRPDFEAVISAVLDHLERAAKAHPEFGLDLERIAIAGGSMGAYYSLRACTDRRVKACVAIDGFYSLWAVALDRMPGWYASLWLSGWLPEWAFDQSIHFGMAMDFSTRWEFGLGMAMMGTSTPGNTLRRFQQFSLDVPTADGRNVLDNIRCPVLLTGASRSLYASAQDGTVAVAQALKQVPEPSLEVWIPEDIGNGGMTGKVGAWALLAQKSFQFLDKHLEVKRAPCSRQS